MQEIPRNELLDKLAAGWTVWHKDWDTDEIAHKDDDLKIKIIDLISEKWQGEPPLRKRFTDCNCVFAFKELYENGAKFVKRKIWDKGSGYDINNDILLGFDDLIATDWEVYE